MQCSRDCTCHKDDNQSAVFTCFGRGKKKKNKEKAGRLSGIMVNRHYPPKKRGYALTQIMKEARKRPGLGLLPPLHVVLPRPKVGVVVPGTRLVLTLARSLACRTTGLTRGLALLGALRSRIFLKVGHIVRGMSALEECVGGRTLLLTLPQQVAS